MLPRPILSLAAFSSELQDVSGQSGSGSRAFNKRLISAIKCGLISSHSSSRTHALHAIKGPADVHFSEHVAASVSSVPKTQTQIQEFIMKMTTSEMGHTNKTNTALERKPPRKQKDVCPLFSTGAVAEYGSKDRVDADSSQYGSQEYGSADINDADGWEQHGGAASSEERASMVERADRDKVHCDTSLSLKQRTSKMEHTSGSNTASARQMERQHALHGGAAGRVGAGEDAYGFKQHELLKQTSPEQYAPAPTTGPTTVFIFDVGPEHSTPQAVIISLCLVHDRGQNLLSASSYSLEFEGREGKEADIWNWLKKECNNTEFQDYMKEKLSASILRSLPPCR